MISPVEEVQEILEHISRSTPPKTALSLEMQAYIFDLKDNAEKALAHIQKLRDETPDHMAACLKQLRDTQKWQVKPKASKVYQAARALHDFVGGGDE